MEILTTTELAFIYAANSSQIIQRFANFSSPKWNAFLGFIVHRNSSHNCLLMDQASAENPFKFVDESEIAAIVSFDEGSCEWHFEGPKGYGMKIVLQFFCIGSMDLFATNSTGYSVLGASNYNQTQPWAYYNPDNHLNIYLNHRTIYYKYRFQAYITIVKNSWNEIPDPCIFEKVDLNTAVWKIKDYPLNTQCHLEITVQPKTEVVAIFTMYDVETNVDQINVYYPNGTKLTITEDMNNIAVFEPFNSSKAIYKGEFLSDGSVRSGGFEVVLQTIDCICAAQEIIIQCGAPKIYYIMNETVEYYCKNMKCSFHISIDPTCPEKQILFQTYQTMEDNSNGFEYQIYTNKILFFDSNNLDYSDEYDPWEENDLDDILQMPFVINSTKKIELQFLSEMANTRPFHFQFSGIATPKNDENFIITKETSWMTFNFHSMPENSYVTFQLSDELESDDLEVFTSNRDALKCFVLYSDSSKTEVLSYFNRAFTTFAFIQYPYLYIPESKSLAIYRPYNCTTDGGFTFIRAKNENSKNCYFKNAVFYYNSYDITKLITATAKETGFCEVTILTNVNDNDETNYGIGFNYGRQVIKSLWTTSIDSNITVYINTNKTQTFFSFNKETAKLYQNIILGAPIYTIQIPANSSIALNYRMIDTQNISNIFTFNSLPFKAFIDTPFFGMPNMAPIEYGLLGIYKIENFRTEFRVDVFDLSSDAQLYLIDSKNERTSLTHVGQKISYLNTVIEVFYFEPNIRFNGARISISSVT